MSDEMMIVENSAEIERTHGSTFADRIMQEVSEAGFFATFDTSKVEGQKKLYKATNASKLLREYMETPLAVVDFVFSPTTVTTEQGETEQVMGVYLMDKDGTAYVSSSNGVIRSALQIIAMFGNPAEWEEPLEVVCRESNTAKGRRYKYLDLV